jgi:hypothetical protein
MADPIWREINSAAVSTGFNPLFDHLFTVYFEFDFAVGHIGGDFFFICGNLIAVLIFIIWHLDLPLSDIKIGAAAIPLLRGLRLILVAGCCKHIVLKATIQLHCIGVKGKRNSTDVSYRNY